MGPYLSENEVVRFKEFSARIKLGGHDTWVLKPVNSRCPLWSYEDHCTRYGERPLDCRLYPFMVKDDNMIIHLTCPDAVRLLNLLDADFPFYVSPFRTPDVEAERFYINAKDIILNASEKYLRYLEYQTKDFRFYCVVK